MFFEAMESINITRAQVIEKPFLTDQHKALKHVFADCKHFFCLRHLIENFGSNSYFGQIVRRLAFSSTREEFTHQAYLTSYDIRALEERGALYNETKLNRLYKRFGRSDIREFSVQTWDQQSIWNRAIHGVSTCSNHAEGIHRAINAAASGAILSHMRLHEVLECIIKRYNSGKLYLHEQGTKLLKKLKKQQIHLQLQQPKTCNDERCGWKHYFRRLMNTNYFPCVHEVGITQVVWFQPEQRPLLNPVENSINISDYTGDWELPQEGNTNHNPLTGIENEWHRDAETAVTFIVTLATEVNNMRLNNLIYPNLIAALALRYKDFLQGQEQEEGVETRSAFRADIWLEAENNAGMFC
jgi:hypothetical protein